MLLEVLFDSVELVSVVKLEEHRFFDLQVRDASVPAVLLDLNISEATTLLTVEKIKYLLKFV